MCACVSGVGDVWWVVCVRVWCGVCEWCVCVVGVYVRCACVVCVCGVREWCARVVCASGVCMCVVVVVDYSLQHSLGMSKQPTHLP